VVGERQFIGGNSALIKKLQRHGRPAASLPKLSHENPSTPLFCSTPLPSREANFHQPRFRRRSPGRRRVCGRETRSSRTSWAWRTSIPKAKTRSWWAPFARDFRCARAQCLHQFRQTDVSQPLLHLGQPNGHGFPPAFAPVILFGCNTQNGKSESSSVRATTASAATLQTSSSACFIRASNCSTSRRTSSR
jgi:hypothetical protein